MDISRFLKRGTIWVLAKQPLISYGLEESVWETIKKLKKKIKVTEKVSYLHH